MKKEIVKLFALLVFGATIFSSCSIENRNHRGRYDNGRHHDRHDDRNRGY
ncbi:MAG: hypothetical protein V4456_03505 [Bacteroidota bacterium]